MHDELLTTKEVADELKVDIRKVYRMLRTSQLPHYDLGYKMKRVRRADLDQYVAATKVTTTVEPERRLVFGWLNEAIERKQWGDVRCINEVSKALGVLESDLRSSPDQRLLISGSARRAARKAADLPAHLISEAIPLMTVLGGFFADA